MTKLNSNLIPKIMPLTFEGQMIIGNRYRISVLTSRMIRVETKGKFLDKATQSVWYRDFNRPAYKTEEKDKYLLIITDEVTFYFHLISLKIRYVKIGEKLLKCNNKYNLKGTARTLDFTFGPVSLSDGVISSNGVAVLDDSKSLILDDDGMVKPREQACDKYIFAYGKDYRGSIIDFFKLTGRVPLIPRYVLGNWWSRYRAYSDSEYINLMQQFIDRKIPITVATIDMDWHWVDINKRFELEYKGRLSQGGGWTGYSWNTELFPDYKAFLKWLKDNNLKVTLNLHPADGVRRYEDMHKEMAKEMGISDNEDIPFDITDPNFINAYFKVLHHPYEKQGVDFWWIDWQQGKKSKLKGLDPLWSLNHYHFLDNGNNRRPLILSRYAGVGSHRYPLGFSGDTAINWRVFKFQPYFTVTASNIGYTWWSHDIGGHHFGYKDNELYLRWVQFGVFSPILRLHSTSNDLLGKEPWNYPKDIENFSIEQLRLRHSLIPYLYTMNYRTHTEGIALMEPMYYLNPSDPQAYKVPNQYYFGSELIVCPITRKVDKALNMAYVDAWLPEGRWTDVFTGHIYQGGKNIKMYRGLESIPVLAKEGAILPIACAEDNKSDNPINMSIYIYRGNSSFKLYEDGGDIDQRAAITEFEVKEAEQDIIFTINPSEGEIDILPKGRKYTLCFKDITKYEAIEVTINNRSYDYIIDKTGNVNVIVNDIKPTDRIKVKLTNASFMTNLDYRQAGVNLITRYQGRNIIKIMKYRSICSQIDKATYIKKLKKFPRALREAIIEYIDA